MNPLTGKNIKDSIMNVRIVIKKILETEFRENFDIAMDGVNY